MKHFKIVKLTGFLLFFVLFSCKTSFYTKKISDNTEKKNGIIYALPKTKIIADIEITKKIKQKGIFSDFTHLYFSTKNAIMKNETKYFISDISITTTPILDSSQIYRIVASGNLNPLLLNLSKENFISGINLNDVQAGNIDNGQNSEKNSDIKENISDYADISLYSVREIQYDTLYKEVLKDSVMIKVPFIRKKEVYKSKAKQAKETADIIFNLRDDRYALLTGENDGTNFPDGSALKTMLNELSELEKKYMSLFTGRELKFKKTYRFEYVPENNSDSINEILFYFSEETGITKDTSKIPVTMKIINKKLIPKNVFDDKSEKKGIIYRIPDKAGIKLISEKKELYKASVFISQFGTLNLLPSSLFKDKITVEFYPEYGSLKRISE